MVLRVILQVVPLGDETQTREIGRLDIFNRGRLGPDYCKYGVLDFTKGQEGMYTSDLGHNRSDGAWKLVAQAIKELKLIGP
jgi:hypothetical protein